MGKREAICQAEQIFRGSEMRVSGSEFRTGEASTSTSICTGAMARYIAQWPASYDGAHWNVHCLSASLRIKIPTDMRKQLKINVFSCFNLVRNFKFLPVFILLLPWACFSAIIHCQCPHPGLHTTRCVFVNDQSG